MSCVVSSGNVYCTGGYNPFTNTYSSSSYYASLTSKGIGAWHATSSYPVAAARMACVAYNSTIYCMGGNNHMQLNSSYSANLNAGGIGAWSKISSYPINASGLACAVWRGLNKTNVYNRTEIYCIGGYSGAFSKAVYFSTILKNGISAWNATDNYPIKVSMSQCSSFPFVTSPLSEIYTTTSTTSTSTTSTSSTSTVSTSTTPTSTIQSNYPSTKCFASTGTSSQCLSPSPSPNSTSISTFCTGAAESNLSVNGNPFILENASSSAAFLYSNLAAGSVSSPYNDSVVGCVSFPNGHTGIAFNSGHSYNSTYLPFSYNFSQNIACNNNQVAVIIGIACGKSACSSISVPSNCTEIYAATSNDGNASVYGYECNGYTNVQYNLTIQALHASDIAVTALAVRCGWWYNVSYPPPLPVSVNPSSSCNSSTGSLSVCKPALPYPNATNLNNFCGGAAYNNLTISNFPSYIFEITPASGTFLYPSNTNATVSSPYNDSTVGCFDFHVPRTGLVNASGQIQNANSYHFSYNFSQNIACNNNQIATMIIVACGKSACSSISVPSYCQKEFASTSNDGDASVYGYECNGYTNVQYNLTMQALHASDIAVTALAVRCGWWPNVPSPPLNTISTSTTPTSTTSTSTTSTSTTSTSTTSTSSTSSTSTSSTSTSSTSSSSTSIFTTTIPTIESMSSPGFYCIGGGNASTNTDITNRAFYSVLSKIGITNWIPTTTYPFPALWPGCVATNGFIYCTGGYNSLSNTEVTSSYYTSTTPYGLGMWVPTTNYPFNMSGMACVSAATNFNQLPNEMEWFETSGLSSFVPNSILCAFVSGYNIYSNVVNIIQASQNFVQNLLAVPRELSSMPNIIANDFQKTISIPTNLQMLTQQDLNNIAQDFQTINDTLQAMAYNFPCSAYSTQCSIINQMYSNIIGLIKTYNDGIYRINALAYEGQNMATAYNNLVNKAENLQSTASGISGFIAAVTFGYSVISNTTNTYAYLYPSAATANAFSTNNVVLGCDAFSVPNSANTMSKHTSAVIPAGENIDFPYAFNATCPQHGNASAVLVLVACNQSCSVSYDTSNCIPSFSASSSSASGTAQVYGYQCNEKLNSIYPLSVQQTSGKSFNVTIDVIANPCDLWSSPPSSASPGVQALPSTSLSSCTSSAVGSWAACTPQGASGKSISTLCIAASPTDIELAQTGIVEQMVSAVASLYKAATTQVIPVVSNDLAIPQRIMDIATDLPLFFDNLTKVSYSINNININIQDVVNLFAYFAASQSGASYGASGYNEFNGAVSTTVAICSNSSNYKADCDACYQAVPQSNAREYNEGCLESKGIPADYITKAGGSDTFCNNILNNCGSISINSAGSIAAVPPKECGSISAPTSSACSVWMLGYAIYNNVTQISNAISGTVNLYNTLYNNVSSFVSNAVNIINQGNGALEQAGAIYSNVSAFITNASEFATNMAYLFSDVGQMSQYVNNLYGNTQQLYNTLPSLSGENQNQLEQYITQFNYYLEDLANTDFNVFFILDKYIFNITNTINTISGSPTCMIAKPVPIYYAPGSVITTKLYANISFNLTNCIGSYIYKLANYSGSLSSVASMLEDMHYGWQSFNSILSNVSAIGNDIALTANGMGNSIPNCLNLQNYYTWSPTYAGQSGLGSQISSATGLNMPSFLNYLSPSSTNLLNGGMIYATGTCTFSGSYSYSALGNQQHFNIGLPQNCRGSIGTIQYSGNQAINPEGMPLQNDLYCIGGYNSTGYTNRFFTAPLSSNGIGNFIYEYVESNGGGPAGNKSSSLAATYPFKGAFQSCVALNGTTYYNGYLWNPLPFCTLSIPIFGIATVSISVTSSGILISAGGVKDLTATPGNIFCFGGYDADTGKDTNASYTSLLTMSGIGNIPGTVQIGTGSPASSYWYPSGQANSSGMWIPITKYPMALQGMSCQIATFGGPTDTLPFTNATIYCIGGYNVTTHKTTNVAFYTNLIPHTIMPKSYFLWVFYTIGNIWTNYTLTGWKPTTAYPIPVSGMSCSVANQYIYCTGGLNSTQSSISNSYYAPISTQGIGAWVPTSQYPLKSSGMACVPSTQYYIPPFYPLLCNEAGLTSLQGIGTISCFNWNDLIGFVTWAAGAIITGNPFV
ncbi:MAG: hypothetical protein QXD11_00995 [Candidatus Micrarchaeaceae archaeon]